MDGQELPGDPDRDGHDNLTDPDSDGDGTLDGSDSSPYGDESFNPKRKILWAVSFGSASRPTFYRYLRHQEAVSDSIVNRTYEK